MFTDHSAALAIAKQTSLTTSSTNKLNLRLVKASQYLSQFQLDIRYRPGKQHVVPNALSRLPNHDHKQRTEDLLDEPCAFHAAEDEAHVFAASHAEMSTEFKEAILAGYEKDKHFSRILMDLQGREDENGAFVLRDDLIYHVDSFDRHLRLCIPKDLH